MNKKISHSPESTSSPFPFQFDALSFIRDILQERFGFPLSAADSGSSSSFEDGSRNVVAAASAADLDLYFQNDRKTKL
jgi:hypothetical protein